MPGILSIGLTSWPLQRFFQLLLSWPDLITICSSTQSLLILAALHTARYPTAKHRTLNPLPDLLTSHSTNHSLKLLKKALVCSKQFAPLHGIKWENELWPNEAWDANFIKSVWKPPEVFSLDRSQTVFQKHDYILAAAQAPRIRACSAPAFSAASSRACEWCYTAMLTCLGIRHTWYIWHMMTWQD